MRPLVKINEFMIYKKKIIYCIKKFKIVSMRYSKIIYHKKDIGEKDVENEEHCCRGQMMPSLVEED
jgi:hypothetical protein